MKPTRPSAPGGGSAGDPSRLNRVASRRSSLRFGRNTPGPVLPVGAPPSRALSAGRLPGLGAHARSTTGSSTHPPDGVSLFPVLLREADRTAVRKHFEDLAGPVSATLYSRHDSPLVLPDRTPCPTCGTTEALLREVGELSEKLTVEVRDVDEVPDAARAAGIAHLPAIEFTGVAKGRVRFLGLPDGHEFGSLITAATWISGAPLTISKETTDQLSMLRRPLHVKVFTTPT